MSASIQELSGNVLEEVYQKRADQIIRMLSRRWEEKQRYYHTLNGHLIPMLELINAKFSKKKHLLMTLLALFHDAVYLPGRADNEEKSAELFEDSKTEIPLRDRKEIAEAIRQSRWQGTPVGALAREFLLIDCAQLRTSTPAERWETERNIFREYQSFGWETYRETRLGFLEGFGAAFPEMREGALAQKEALQAFHPRIGVYPGSFNPFHIGHLSVLRNAERLFDQVIVAVGENNEKAGTPNANDRADTVKNLLAFHQVVGFRGYISTLLKTTTTPKEHPPGVIRGVRGGHDLESELKYQRYLLEMCPENPVVWIGCNAELGHISSGDIRGMLAIEKEGSSEEYSTRYLPTTESIYELPHGE